MLQLRREERFRPRVHPGEGGFGCRAALSATVRGAELTEGHELGSGAVEAVDFRPVFLDMAREDTERAGAAAGEADIGAAD